MPASTVVRTSDLKSFGSFNPQQLGPLERKLAKHLGVPVQQVTCSIGVSSTVKIELKGTHKGLTNGMELKKAIKAPSKEEQQKEVDQAEQKVQQFEKQCEELAESMSTTANQAATATRGGFAALQQGVKQKQTMLQRFMGKWAPGVGAKLKTEFDSLERKSVELTRTMQSRSRTVEKLDQTSTLLKNQSNGFDKTKAMTAKSYLKGFKNERQKYATQVNEQNEILLQVTLAVSEGTSKIDEFDKTMTQVSQICEQLHQAAVSAKRDVDDDFEMLKNAALELSELQKAVVKFNPQDRQAKIKYESIMSRCANLQKDAEEGRDGVDQALTNLNGETAQPLQQLQHDCVANHAPSKKLFSEYVTISKHCKTMAKTAATLCQTAEKRWKSIENEMEDVMVMVDTPGR